MSLACLLAQTPSLAQTAEPAGGDGIVAVPRQSIWDRVTDSAAWQGPGYWRALYSPYTQHYRYSPEHRHVWAVGIERQLDDDWLAGASYFSNSFGQPSGYVYIGHRNEALFDVPQLYFQWSAGMLYGYVGKYKNKVPLNVDGFSPGLLVTLGWQLTRQVSVSVHALGDAGVMLQLAYDLH